MIKTGKYKDSTEFEPIMPLSVYYSLDEKYEAKIANEGCLITFMHIHNKAIYDSVNEALNLIKPYGINGEPMPWSSQPRISFKDITDQVVVLKNIKNIILDWTSFEVGTLPNAEFVLNGKFDEEYFVEIREKQLAILLSQEVLFVYNQVVDNEEQWLNYDKEETAIKLDLTERVLQDLVIEAIQYLVQIEQLALSSH